MLFWNVSCTLYYLYNFRSSDRNQNAVSTERIQKSFFLPDCWLRLLFGAAPKGSGNVPKATLLGAFDDVFTLPKSAKFEYFDVSVLISASLSVGLV